MKMIASTKLAKAQRAMQNGKQYGLAGQEVFQQSKGEGEEAPKKKRVVKSRMTVDAKGYMGMLLVYLIAASLAYSVILHSHRRLLLIRVCRRRGGGASEEGESEESCCGARKGEEGG